MPDKLEFVNIDGLDDAEPLQGDEYIEIIQNGKNVKVTLTAVQQFLGGGSPSMYFPYSDFPLENMPVGH